MLADAITKTQIEEDSKHLVIDFDTMPIKSEESTCIEHINTGLESVLNTVCIKIEIEEEKTDSTPVLHLLQADKNVTNIDDTIPYQCDICDTHFREKSRLELHMTKKHGMAKKHQQQCAHCETWCKTLVELQEHIHQCHPKIFKCDLCSREFAKKIYLQRHTQNMHTQNKKFSCSLCEKSFGLKSVLQNHMVFVHSDERKFGCNICSKSFKKRSLLRLHEISHLSSPERGLIQTKKVVKVVDPEVCQLCGKIFSGPQSYMSHLRTHSDDRPYKCDVCEKSFKHSSTYYQHKRSHSDVRAYKCNICEKTFKKGPTYYQHMRSHSDARPFACDVCGKCFKTNMFREQHTRQIHLDIRPYKCDVCDMRFKQSGQLKTHSRSHTGEKPFECEHCGKAFALKMNCQVHQRSHTGEKPYQCQECDECFKDMNSLKRHRKKCHTPEN